MMLGKFAVKAFVIAYMRPDTVIISSPRFQKYWFYNLNNFAQGLFIVHNIQIYYTKGPVLHQNALLYLIYLEAIQT